MIGVIGGGAFGIAMAVTLAKSNVPVLLWARDTGALRAGQSDRLPGVRLPDTVGLTDDILEMTAAGVVLLCLPMQALGGFLGLHGAQIDGGPLVACCKGIDLATGRGATALIATFCKTATPALLTGPSFAADIARGLPTALTLACADDAAGAQLQTLLSTATLRLYRTTDVIGAELGGAVKNVIAIAAGLAIGAGQGDSARAAIVTRGYAEMLRLAVALGARPETLAGLSGLGDLVLTCTSAQSRNFRFGMALAAGERGDAGMTVEGVATARAVIALAQRHSVEMPITGMVAALVEGSITLPDAIQALLSRPLRQE
jgi:glycerol-3-phosphate dehydrogenase (NAD(P)+)